MKVTVVLVAVVVLTVGMMEVVIGMVVAGCVAVEASRVVTSTEVNHLRVFGRLETIPASTERAALATVIAVVDSVSVILIVELTGGCVGTVVDIVVGAFGVEVEAMVTVLVVEAVGEI